SNTGYTGSSGIELVVPLDFLLESWNMLFKHGAEIGLEPIGLLARDSLRLEAGFALYGHEISQDFYPFETVSSWTMKIKNRDFLGKEAILEAKAKSVRVALGIKLKGKKIPRKGYEVFIKNNKVGQITSGGFSPCLNCPIAMALLDSKLKEGDEVQVQIRGQMEEAVLCQLPFIEKIKSGT
ncbi:hypothetical protein AB751O23_BO_00090, partial [Chlamydiales bacterium SCGC AB-751-O23]